MSKSNKDIIITNSSCWVAFVLNIIPGLGSGYIYQRRWRAYWATIFITFIYLIFFQSLEFTLDPSDPLPSQNDQLLFWGLILISFGTSVEAALTYRSLASENK